ncbi:hypothetical protein BU16DRAFT_565287 [Lophium mytilinum]|uniref:Uncharacterized protein n=1 Tax=Lophium mytilinum TaxID=390894 RepID=A0A6A6QJG0_9PEZI|nr:hypothetical protein BU16DRAFT_565287 [Lophium mytilinum]
MESVELWPSPSSPNTRVARQPRQPETCIAVAQAGGIVRWAGAEKLCSQEPPDAARPRGSAVQYQNVAPFATRAPEAENRALRWLRAHSPAPSRVPCHAFSPICGMDAGHVNEFCDETLRLKSREKQAFKVDGEPPKAVLKHTKKHIASLNCLPASISCLQPRQRSYLPRERRGPLETLPRRLCESPSHTITKSESNPLRGICVHLRLPPSPRCPIGNFNALDLSDIRISPQTLSAVPLMSSLPSFPAST